MMALFPIPDPDPGSNRAHVRRPLKMASKSKTSAMVTAQVLPPSSVAGGSGSSGVTPATLSAS